MGCTSSREKNVLLNLESILQKYTEIANNKDLILSTSTENDEKDENDYYQFAAKLITSKPLSPSLLKEKRKLRSALPYPFYLIGWKFEKKIIAIGSAYEYKTMNEKVAVIQDIFADAHLIEEKSLDLLMLQSLLVKALTTIVFEMEKVDQVRFEGDPSLFLELTKSKTEPKLSFQQYSQLKESSSLLDHKPIPLELNLFEKVGDTVTSGVSFVGNGVVSGVSMVGNGVVSGVTAVGSGVVTAGKFVGNTVVTATTKVGDAIIPGKKEEKKENEMELNKNDQHKEEEKDENHHDEKHDDHHHEELHIEEHQNDEHHNDEHHNDEHHHEEHHDGPHEEHHDGNHEEPHENIEEKDQGHDEDHQQKHAEIKEVNVDIKHEEKEGMDIEKVTQAEEN